MAWQRKRPPGEPLESGSTGDGDETPRFVRKSCYEKMMDHLARRSYSEFELRRKLEPYYAKDDIDDAISRAVASKWLTPAEEMSEKIADDLGRKRKGHRFINQALKQKGLPPVKEDTEAEFEKARALVSARLKHDFSEGPLPRELYEKAQRLLYTRGFTSDVIRRTLAR